MWAFSWGEGETRLPEENPSDFFTARRWGVSNWKEEAWKYRGLNRIRTRDLRDTGAMLDQLSCEATHWEQVQFVEFSSGAVKWCEIHICTAVVVESEDWSSQ